MNEFKGTVRIVGAGLLGTSIGLALTKQGADVIITSRSKSSADLAISYGAGRAPVNGDNPSVIIVCVPPRLTAQVVADELRQFPTATVTDVASIKVAILQELKFLGAPIERYVGSHPMAGRERGGAISGRADLFVGRPWVITTHEKSDATRITEIENLAKALDSSPIKIDANNHDRAVALVSHAPQVISSLLASRLIDGEASDISLAGQGLRDTTRIAASDPELWVQILAGNNKEVLSVLKNFETDLEKLIKSLESADSVEADNAILKVLESGNRGVERIPGKHGTKHSRYAQIVVMIDDKPGELGRLFAEVGEIGINIEELQLEHSPSAEIGLVELFVKPENERILVDDLVARGWRIAG